MTASSLSRLALLVVLLMAACSPAPQPSPTPAATNAPAPPTPVVSVPSAAPTSPRTPVPTPGPENVTPLADAVLVVYEKSGCFAGVHDTLTVYRDGRLDLIDRLGKRRMGQASADALRPLQQILSDPAFAQLQPLYQAAGADLCIYSIAAAINGQVRTFTTMDAAPTPDILMQAVNALERLRGLTQ